MAKQHAFLGVRLTDEESDALRSQAAALHVTMSELVRRLLGAAADRFEPATIDHDSEPPTTLETEVTR